MALSNSSIQAAIFATLQCTVYLDTVLDSGEVPTLEATEAVLAGAGVEAADTDLASWWRRDSDLRTLR